MALIAHHQSPFSTPTNRAAEWLSWDKTPRLFVVKLHDATSLHYDFRLEYGGVLKSWVVPKGPCLDASKNRLAKQVGDHAINCFEGIIPAGMYGAGTIMLWDWGFWTTDQDVREALHAGQLSFQLYGEKLKGSWTLTRRLPRSDQGLTNWTLRKVLDNEARSLREFNVLTEQPLSVKTGRTLDEIALTARMPKQTSDPRQRILFLDDRLP